MAATVVKCRACNARVARTDNECPSCGVPKPGVHAGEAILTAFVCVFGVLFLIGAMNSSTDSSPSYSPTYSSYCSKPRYDPDYIWDSCPADSPRHRRHYELLKDVWDDVTGK